jgi:hypothetical protein
MSSNLMGGWIPVRVKKMRQSNNQSFASEAKFWSRETIWNGADDCR